MSHPSPRTAAGSGLRGVAPLAFAAALLCGGILSLNLLRGAVAGSAAPKPSVPAPADAGTHGHRAAHNPNVQSFGDNHLEAQILKSGLVRVFVLDEAAKSMTPIEAPELEAELQPEGEDPTPVTLAARPMPGETEGICSRFEGRIPDALKGKPVGLTVSLSERGGSYRLHFAPTALDPGAFASAAATAHDDAGAEVAMPAAPPADEEERLFLTPGGLYTEADIAANRRTTPARKFAGLMANHGKAPATGERICPITDTRADARFEWVIGGKAYRFCCPPCVAEFVKRAKEDPGSVKAPEAYVKG